MTTPELRPMAIGELIDRSASEWRQSWRELFLLFLPFQVAEFMLLKGYELAGAQLFPLFQRSPLATQEPPELVLGQAAWASAAMLALGPLLLLNSWLGALAVGRFITPRCLGRPRSRADAFARMRSRGLATLGAVLISLLWLAGVGLLATLPGVGLGALAAWLLEGTALVVAVGLAAALVLLGLLTALLWYTLRFLLTPQVLAVEEVGGWEAIRRSGSLISGRVGPGIDGRMFMRATLGVTAMALILFAVNLLSAGPGLALQMIYAPPLDPNSSYAAIPQGLLVPAQLLQVASQGVVGPLFAAFRVMLYLDVRVRREGLDLELQLDALEGPQAAA